MILASLAEGTPINAVCRMFTVGKNGVLRIIEETGEALINYMLCEFRDLPCERVAMDEQWQYVGIHGQRMAKKEAGRGDFWLWAAIDSDTKLLFSFLVGRRDWNTGEDFVRDAASRVRGPVQIATDPHRSYAAHIPAYFGEGASYGTDKKIFSEGNEFKPEEFGKRRKNGVQKIVTSEREALMGNPNLATLTTSHIERFFLTMRQEVTRFTRLTLGYSKDLRMHKLATALHIGIYNLVRKHTSLDGQTPAQAAGVEEKRWTTADVVAMTEAYWAPKVEAEKKAKAAAKRLAEDAEFERALAGL